ncbi:hypothetical protein BH10BAC2_BH10BAC2_46540 [soil metagenome]
MNQTKWNNKVARIRVDTEHVISDELMREINLALANGENWMAYNKGTYFLEMGEVCFFKDKDSAYEFAENNISDYDIFKVIRFDSITDLLQQIPYGKEFERTLTDPDANGLYNKEGNNFTDAIIDHWEKKQIIINKKQIIMNEKNVTYLKDNIKYLGFGEKLNPELDKNIAEGKNEFQLHYNADINKKPFEATLNFRKSDSSDMYFFNNYHASLEKNNSEKTEQTFYLSKGKGITSKEAFNLLDGRAVHKDLTTKEGQPYKAWVQLDFEKKDQKNNFEIKQFHEKYGFDLKAAVEKFPITDLKDQEKEKVLMQSLQKGNVQSVTIEKDSNSYKMFIEADPQYKKLNLYDANMKLVSKESIEKYQSTGTNAAKAVNEELENDKKKELKLEVKPDKEKLEKKKDKSLLPKKRESNKKGLGVS